MSRHIIKLVMSPLVAALVIASTAVPAATTSRAVQTLPAAEVEGRGWWEQAACIDCMATIAAASGGSVAGVVEVGSISDGYVAACAATCTSAYAR